MEAHSVGQQPGAASAHWGGLRLGAPAFSPSGDGTTGTPLHRDTLAAGRSPAQKQMIGDQLYPTIA
eukprot:2871717-Lingulodinium_polyedra.AAC.1